MASAPSTSTKATEKHMKALHWSGDRSMKLGDCDVPHIVDPTDAIIRVTSTSVCGSDLHLYNKEFSGLKRGDVLGHEFMGIVHEVGSQVKDLQPGNRVVCSFLICCGSCDFCSQGLNSCCDKTNSSEQMAASYGHCISGMFGYTRLTGGYAGGQAEFVRVPCADTVCLKLPSMDQFADEKFLLLSDVMATGFHATECGAVCPGQTVAVWGLGPVGLMAAAFCKFRGASRVFGIDCDSFRLDFAKHRLGLETIDCGNEDVIKALHELAPGGVDVAIDAAGFRFPVSLRHKLQRALHLETDSPDILTQIITCVRKAGNISIVGDYFQLCNGFPIGAVMEKSLTIRGGQTHVQRYWRYLLDLIVTGKFDPSFIITHVWPLERGVEAYKIFDTHQDNCIKFVLKTEFGTALAHQHKWTVDDVKLASANMAPLQSEPPVYINPSVLAHLPWPTYPNTSITNADLPSGELTGLSSSYHKPIKGVCSEAASIASSSAPTTQKHMMEPAGHTIGASKIKKVPDPATAAGGQLA